MLFATPLPPNFYTKTLSVLFHVTILRNGLFVTLFFYSAPQNMGHDDFFLNYFSWRLSWQGWPQCWSQSLCSKGRRLYFFQLGVLLNATFGRYNCTKNCSREKKLTLLSTGNTRKIVFQNVWHEKKKDCSAESFIFRFFGASVDETW